MLTDCPRRIVQLYNGMLQGMILQKKKFEKQGKKNHCVYIIVCHVNFEHQIIHFDEQMVNFV